MIYYITSLKYAPGSAKEFILIEKMLKNEGKKTYYILASGYSKFLSNDDNVLYLTSGNSIKDLILESLASIFYFIKVFKFFLKHGSKKKLLIYNPHPLNPIIQLLVLLFGGSSSIFLHEPTKPAKDRQKLPISDRVYLIIVYFFQYFSILLANSVYCMSFYGFELFNKKFKIFSDKAKLVHLVIPNKTSETFIINKKYFSFIGNATQGKGILEFFRLVKYSMSQINENSELKYCIITSSNIDTYLQDLGDNYDGILTVINKNYISDSEIENIIKKSYAIFLMHKTATQSGILPLAFREGTAVIARKISAFKQYIISDVNGILISENSSSQEWSYACYKILENKEFFSKQSHQTYVKFFSQQNLKKYYQDLI